MVDGRQQQKKRPKRKPLDAEAQKEMDTSRKEKLVEGWVPKTSLGKKVKNGEIASLEQLFDANEPVMEPEMIDAITPGLDEELVEFTKTTRVVRSGRIFAFRASVLVGNRNGFIGIGTAKDKEKASAIRKATNSAKLNMIKTRRGCGSWECTCGGQHSIMMKTDGKCASVRVKLMPAPKGAGLVVGDNIKSVFKFAGINDVWAITSGSTGTRLNFVKAAIDALAKTSRMKISESIKNKIEK